jgi:hypothetical protein
MNFADYFVGPVGLREKVRMVGDPRCRWPSVPRNDQQKNMRPVFVNQARQFHSIDGARQLDIREQDADIWPTRHDVERGVCVSGVDDFKPRFLEKVVHVKAQKRFVLNDEDRGLAGWRTGSHAIQRAAANSVSLAR